MIIVTGLSCRSACCVDQCSWCKFFFLGDITFKQFCLLRSMLPFHGLFVCLSLLALCSNGRRFWHSFFLHMTAHISLPDRVKIWLTSVNPFLPKFYPKVTHPCWFKCRRHSTEDCGRWLEIALWSQWRGYRYRKSPSNGTIADPLWPSLTKYPICSRQEQICDASCHLLNMIVERCRLLSNYFGPCFYNCTKLT